MANLSKTVDIKKNTRKVIEDAGGIAFVFNVMKNHNSNPRAQAQRVHHWQIWPRKSVDIRKVIVDTAGIGFVLNTMNNHITNCNVQAQVCAVLANLVKTIDIRKAI